jgi:hypothetical protein
MEDASIRPVNSVSDHSGGSRFSEVREALQIRAHAIDTFLDELQKVVDG